MTKNAIKITITIIIEHLYRALTKQDLHERALCYILRHCNVALHVSIPLNVAQ